MRHFLRRSSQHAGTNLRAANEDISPPRDDLLTLAKRIVAIRSGRSSFFSPILLSEPGYDMLLAMFIADAERRPMRVADLALAAGVPSSTALRWITTLEELQLIIQIARFPVLTDSFVELQPLGHSQMSDHLGHGWRALRT